MDEHLEQMWAHHKELVKQHAKLRGEFDALGLVFSTILRSFKLSKQQVDHVEALIDVMHEAVLASEAASAADQAKGFRASADALLGQLRAGQG